MSTPADAFRLDYVEGVTPAKWLRIWSERMPQPVEAVRTEEPAQLDRLRAGEADMAFVRLPIADDGLSVIPLWEEQPFVLAPRENAIAAVDELTVADIADEARLPAAEDYAYAMRAELVAAGLGIAIVPQSVARLYARRDVAARPLTDAEPTRIGLAWPAAATTPEVEEFIGIVRGRTANSSRGQGAGAGAGAREAAASKTSATGARAGRQPASGGGARGTRGAASARRSRRGRR